MLYCIHHSFGDARMRRSRIVGATFGILLVAGACATSTGTTSSSRFEMGPSTPRTSRTLSPAERDSVFAQAVADREGPRASIAVEFDNAAGSRRLRANFRLDDDAYVLVGHLDADGVLRIAFPTEPGDDGFVRGQRSYQTAQFFAGFTDQYRYRASTGLFHATTASYDSYDGGLGYVFIIASWRPMHFDRFATGGAWDSFEVADADYVRDPRPAIYELASLLVGENREAYTVKFARYTDTRALYSGYGNYSSALGYGYCTGYAPFGFAASPFETRYAFNPLFQYGSSFMYRGSSYYYDAAQDCYRSAPTFFGYQYGGLAFGLPIATPPSRPRVFNLDGPRRPLAPRVPPGHVMPLNSGGQSAGTITDGSQAMPAVSPHYRQRGLLTPDEPSTGPVRRQPRVEARPIDDGARPSIQEMTNRRGGASSPGETRGYSRPTASDNPRPAPAARSEPRGQSSPRMEAPARTSPPPERASPRAEPAARSQPEPRSQPASSGSKPPEKVPHS